MCVLKFAFHLILELRLVTSELLQLLSVHLNDLVFVFPLHDGVTYFLLELDDPLLELGRILTFEYGHLPSQVFALFLQVFVFGQLWFNIVIQGRQSARCLQLFVH